MPKRKGILVHAYCVMPSHLHLIISAVNNNLSDITREFKKFTSAKILKTIEDNNKESRRNWMLWIFKKAGEKNERNTFTILRVRRTVSKDFQIARDFVSNKRKENPPNTVPTPSAEADTPPRRGISSLLYTHIFYIIKVEKRFTDEGLRCLAENPFVRNEQKIVGGQRTNV